MRNFEIIMRGQYIFIQSISYINPINELKDIAHELHTIKYEGEVIFDLLLANGNTSNRFLISKFIDKRFEMKSFKKTIISQDIRNEIANYYKNHSDYLSNSILTSSMIEEIN
jgi:hypothetical protein